MPVTYHKCQYTGDIVPIKDLTSVEIHKMRTESELAPFKTYKDKEAFIKTDCTPEGAAKARIFVIDGEAEFIHFATAKVKKVKNTTNPGFWQDIVRAVEAPDVLSDS